MDKKIEPKKITPKKASLLSGAVLLVLVIIYTRFFNDGNSSVQVDRERLIIHEIEEGNFTEFIDVNGTVQPLRTTYLDAIEGGVVQQVFEQSGAMVEEGDTILILSRCLIS